MSNAKGIVVAVVLVILAGGGGFYGGMQYQKAQTPSFAQGGFGGPGGIPGGGTSQGQGQNGNGQRQGAPVSGQVVSKDSSSITVKLTDGSTKIVMLSSKASIGKFTTVKASEIREGEQVTAFGTTNSDGSVTASMIQLGRPAGMFGNRSPGANGNNSGGGSGNAGGNNSNSSGNVQQ
ncbi:MAG TPA: hypothetical protein VGK02_05485 [Candidatus Aquicultor sp.]|jgi:hypothetical protein